MFSLVLIVVLVKNGTFAWFQLMCDRRTAGQMDRQTDRRTYPLIEMRERIQKNKRKKSQDKTVREKGKKRYIRKCTRNIKGRDNVEVYENNNQEKEYKKL